MGICSSEEDSGGWPKESKPDPALKWSYAVKQHPPRSKESIRDSAHYQAKHLRNQTFCRGPGTVNGNQIQIEDCEDCDIYLCDEMDSVLMDDCKNCRLFIGPASGSVFLRTSSSCKIVIACGQLRLRECTDMDFSIYCSSKPVIESSKRIRFSCFDGYYFNLREQLDAAKMSVFNNRWSDIHDFTPKSSANYDYLDASLKLKDLIKPLSVGIPDLISAEEESNPNAEIVIPKTWGLRDLPAQGEVGFVLFLPNHLDTCITFLQDLASKHPSLLLTQTKESILPLKDAPQIFSQSNIPKDMKKTLVSGPSISVGVFGVGATDACQQLLHQKEGCFVASSPAEAKYLHEQMFAKHQLGGDFRS